MKTPPTLHPDMYTWNAERSVWDCETREPRNPSMRCYRLPRTAVQAQDYADWQAQIRAEPRIFTDGPTAIPYSRKAK